MTEREAVAELKKFAKKNHCRLREDKYDNVRYDHVFDEAFVIGWSGDVVSFFSFTESPADPPEDILRAFQHLEKVNIHPASRPLSWLKYLDSIRILEIYSWNEQRLPDKLTFASSLEILYLVTMTGKIPSEIRQFRALRRLGLDSPKTLELPGWISYMRKLDRVLLRNCTIENIPESIWSMGLPFIFDDTRTERGVFLHGSVMKSGDINLFRKSRDEIEQHYRNAQALERGNPVKVPSECKVIFIGDGAVGKSSLIDRLTNPDRKFRSGESAPTNGIKMKKWLTTIEDKPFVLRLMDFGGQEIMHSIHRCFMTENTIYVVVCESRVDADIDLNAVRWLETVKTFAPNSPVILALNKADLNGNASVNEKDLKKRNPALRCVLKTSANTESDYGVSELVRWIKHEAPECDIKREVGSNALAVKQELEDLLKSDDDPPERETSRAYNVEVNINHKNKNRAYNVNKERYYISSERYKDICRKHHIHDPEDQKDMLSWFRDLGIVYSYETNQKGELDKSLQGVLVLNPEWLSNGIYRVILHAPEDGFPTHAEIRKTLKTVYKGDLSQLKYEKSSSADEPEFILHVMRKFELSKSLTKDREMIPSKLPKTPPDQAEEFFKDHPEKILHIRWKGKYLPNNLIHWLMIRRFSELDDSGKRCVWRTGARFYGKDLDRGFQSLAEMNDSALDLYAKGAPGQDSRLYLRKFHKEVSAILQEIHIQATEMVCYRFDGMEDEISYDALMAQNYIMPKQNVLLPVIQKTVLPLKMLQENYIDYEERIREYKWRKEFRYGFDERKEQSLPPQSRSKAFRAFPGNLKPQSVILREIVYAFTSYPGLFALLGLFALSLLGALFILAALPA